MSLHPHRPCAFRLALGYNSLRLPTFRTPISSANLAGMTAYTFLSFSFRFPSIHFARGTLVPTALDSRINIPSPGLAKGSQ